MIDQTNIINYILGRPCDEKELYATLDSLVSLVILRHFSGYADDEDARSAGVVKAVALLKSKHVDVERNLFNFLYAGIRNAVSTHIKKILRRPTISVPDFNTQRGVDYFDPGILVQNCGGHLDFYVHRFQAFQPDVRDGVDIFLRTLDFDGCSIFVRSIVQASFFHGFKE